MLLGRGAALTLCCACHLTSSTSSATLPCRSIASAFALRALQAHSIITESLQMQPLKVRTGMPALSMGLAQSWYPGSKDCRLTWS